MYHCQPSIAGEKDLETKKQSTEIGTGFIPDVLLESSLHFFYDFDCKEVDINSQIR
jgi:hypothetical protein